MSMQLIEYCRNKRLEKLLERNHINLPARGKLKVTRKICIICVVLFAFSLGSMFVIGLIFCGQPEIPEIAKVVFNSLAAIIFLTFFPGPGSFLVSIVYVSTMKNDSIYSKSAKSSPVYWLIWREYRD